MFRQEIYSPKSRSTHLLSQCSDQPVLFGQRDEIARQNRAMLRMLPACQNLETLELPRAKFNYRLEERDDLVIFQGADNVMQLDQHIHLGSLKDIPYVV